jgi:hypothetical protein
VNLGVLGPDQDSSFAFTIVNRDARPLKLVNVTGSCDCIGFTWERGDVAVGGRREVKTDVRAENRGTKLLTVYVQANDSRVTTREVAVRYLVLSDLRFTPPQADFGRRGVGAPAVLPIVASYVQPRGAKPADFAPKAPEDLPLTVRVPGPPEIVERLDGLDDVKQTLELVLDASKPVAPFERSLVFESERHRPAKLRVTGEVHRGFYLDPVQIHLGVANVGDKRRGNARMLWTREQPAIESIECDPPELSAQAFPESGARSFRIVVTFTPTKAGELDGSVRVRTSLDPEPLVLRVKGKVR